MNLEQLMSHGWPKETAVRDPWIAEQERHIEAAMGLTKAGDTMKELMGAEYELGVLRERIEQQAKTVGKLSSENLDLRKIKAENESLIAQLRKEIAKLGTTIGELRGPKAPMKSKLSGQSKMLRSWYPESFSG